MIRLAGDLEYYKSEQKRPGLRIQSMWTRLSGYKDAHAQKDGHRNRLYRVLRLNDCDGYDYERDILIKGRE